MSITTITAHLTEMADQGSRWFGPVLVVKNEDDNAYLLYLEGGAAPPEGRSLSLKDTAAVIQRMQGDTKEFPAVSEPDDDDFGPGVGPSHS